MSFLSLELFTQSSIKGFGTCALAGWQTSVQQMNFTFSFHPLDIFFKKAVIQDPGSGKVDNFQDSRQKFSQDFWQCFYCQCIPAQKSVSHGLVGSSFLHQGSKAMSVAKPQRYSVCAMGYYQAFSSKLSFPWQRNL